MIDPSLVQLLAVALFAFGLATVLTRRNIFFLFMGIELMLNAVNVSFIGFSRTLPPSGSPRRPNYPTVCDCSCCRRNVYRFGDVDLHYSREEPT